MPDELIFNGIFKGIVVIGAGYRLIFGISVWLKLNIKVLISEKLHGVKWSFRFHYNCVFGIKGK